MKAYQFNTRRGINQPIKIVIERKRDSPFVDMEIVIEFKDLEFDNYVDADNFIASPAAKSIMRSVKKYQL